MSKPITPWTPMEYTETENGAKVSMWGRTYSFENGILPTAIYTLGEDILSAPMRLVGFEEGDKPLIWEEVTTFATHADEEKVVLCGSQQAGSIVINTAATIEFDGYIDLDIKVLTRGRTVSEQFFGVKDFTRTFSLNRLWIEIPLKKKIGKNYSYYPLRHLGAPIFEGKGLDNDGFQVSASRQIPSSMALPFKPIVWLGNEDKGISFTADNDKNWQPDDPNRAIEIIDSKEETILRIHLVDSEYKGWESKGKENNQRFQPITFNMGLQATPVKPFPKNPYKEKIFHIDCFEKILIEYSDYLKNPVVEGSDEIGYDYIKRMGVTTLILHEKWNKIQNSFILDLDTKRRTHEIVEECHKRGIKVMPYFGYEISTASPLWSEHADEARQMETPDQYVGWAWYRKPNQRCYRCCGNSDWVQMLADGYCRVIEEFDFDGIYNDTLFTPFTCYNTSHGCGYTDANGDMKPSYPLRALREVAKKIYTFIEKRGGMFNIHNSNCCNIPSFSFAHLQLDGEGVQLDASENGIAGLPLDYMRTEYAGRNFGIPYEFIAYKMDGWTFHDALCLSLVHGMLCRPNYPVVLEIMSGIWGAIDRFNMEESVWKPYWSNGIELTSKDILLSYYESEQNGKKQSLVFISNPTDNTSNNIFFDLGYKDFEVYDAVTQQKMDLPLDFEPRKYYCLLVKEK